MYWGTIDEILNRFDPAKFHELGWYMIVGRGPWDGRHCPNCGSEIWLPLDLGKARCLDCRMEWEAER